MKELISILLLIVFSSLVVFKTARSKRRYEEFLALDQTLFRQRIFSKWIKCSFLIYGVGSIISLVLIGEVNLLWNANAELVSALPFHESLSRFYSNNSSYFVAVLITIVAFIVLYYRKNHLLGKLPKPKVVGNIKPLFPRNNSERKLLSILAVNAGLSEELFFRVLYPILILNVIGNGFIAIVVAVLLFGIVHLYQGWQGVLATFILGLLFTYAYLVTGNIAMAMILHLLIIFNGLVVQSRRFES